MTFDDFKLPEGFTDVGEWTKHCEALAMKHLGLTNEEIKEVKPDVEVRDIPEYERRYAATQDGRIWSYKNKKFLKPCGEDRNYQIVSINDKSVYVHRLVAQAWLPNPDNLPEVNHKDSNKANNAVDNLEWCTHADNVRVNIKDIKIRKPVRCIETQEVFTSIYKAAKATDAFPNNISTHLKYGTPKTVVGYHWEYVTK